MTNEVNKTLLAPELPDLLFNHRKDIFINLNCIKVGIIHSFNASKQTAEVQIVFKRVLSNKSVESYPALVDVPVMIYQGGGASLQLPVQKGDQCLLLFSDRNIDNWFKTGSESAPFDGRCHDLSDAFAIVGVNSSNNSMTSYATDEVALKYGTGKIGIKGNKITLKNGTTDLLTALLAFIDILKTMAITDEAATWPLNAASIAALEAFKTTFQGLLY